jgi:hypothetical protein
LTCTQRASNTWEFIFLVVLGQWLMRVESERLAGRTNPGVGDTPELCNIKLTLHNKGFCLNALLLAFCPFPLFFSHSTVIAPGSISLILTSSKSSVQADSEEPNLGLWSWPGMGALWVVYP